METIEIELWAGVNGYESHYEISSFGRLRSIKFNKIRYMKPSLSPAGYLSSNLSKDGVVETKTIHKMVAEAFIDNVNNKRCVNHLDGNKTNNRVHNLEFVTHSENTIHAHANNLVSRDGQMKAVNQYDAAGNFIKSYKSVTEAAKVSGLTQPGISIALSGRTKTCGGFKWAFASS